MNRAERLSAEIEKLQKENNALQLQKTALEKVVATYQILRASIEHLLQNYQQMKKMFEDCCKENKVQLNLDACLDFNFEGHTEPITYRQIIWTIETLKSLKAEGEKTNGQRKNG